MNTTMLTCRLPVWTRGFAVLAIIFLSASAVQAEPFLDFQGPPSGATSQFGGDWSARTGTLTIDDALVTAVQYQDGTGASVGPWATGSDAALLADVFIQATFVGGLLDNTASNYILISDISNTFYEANLVSGTFETGLAFSIDTFRSVLSSGTTGVGLPIVDTTVSDWFAENYVALKNSGALIFNFDGIAAGSGSAAAGTGVTKLGNITGKLTPTPEPGTLGLITVSIIGLGILRRRRRAAA